MHPGDDELVILFIRTTKALVEDLRARSGTTTDHPMTVMHGLAAHYLSGRDDVTTSDLARYLKVTKQSAGEIVATLEAEGIVARAPHPCDRRARVVQLTDAGRARLDQGRERWAAVEAELAALVGRDRLAVVREVLEAYLASARIKS